MRGGRLPLALLALAIATPSGAQDRQMQTIWLVEPTVPPPGERTLAGGDLVLKQRLLPTGLAELGGAVRLGSGELAAGAQLVAVTTAAAAVYCLPRVARQKLLGASFQPCLVDDDRDGDFDSWFNTVSQTKGLLSVGGSLPRKRKPIEPVAYATVAPSTLRDEYFVAIERRNYFNIYGNESFMIAFGREGELDRITAPVAIKSAELPKPVEILGASFTALSETDGKMTIRVDRAMPAQPFGIVSTTTYSFY